MDKIEKIVNFILSWKFFGPILYILIGFIIYNIVSKILSKIHYKKKLNKKQTTVINLIKNIIKYLIIIIILLLILEIFGINTTKILASLGIIGVIVGLALQDTIKNMLSGILIIFDNRYNVGDYVKINDFTGTVINLGLQTTKLQAYTGETYTITNSNIQTIINYSELNTRVLINLSVAYDTDINKLEKVLTKLNSKIKKLPNIIGNLELLGLDSFNASDMSYVISVECKPNTHILLRRQILKIIKEEFDKQNIEIPFNQIDVHIKGE